MHRRRRQRRDRRDERLREVFGRLGHQLSPTLDEAPAPSAVDWGSLPEGLDPSHGDLQPGRAARKRAQLASMVAHVTKVLGDVPDEGTKVVDFGAGSGHLGLTLAYLFPQIRVVLLERKEWTSNMARRRIGDMSLGNCEARCCSIEDFAASPEGSSFDLAVSLHSCGLLTDRIVHLSVVCGASFVLCPCCYGQIAQAGEHPKSQTLRKVLTASDFESVASAADFTVAAGDWDFLQNRNFMQAKRCMQLVDLDRGASAAEEAAYIVSQGSLVPLNCSPKNNVLIGRAPGGRGSGGELMVKGRGSCGGGGGGGGGGASLGLPGYIQYRPEDYPAALWEKTTVALLKIEPFFVRHSLLEPGDCRSVGATTATDVSIFASPPRHHRLRCRFAIRSAEGTTDGGDSDSGAGGVVTSSTRRRPRDVRLCYAMAAGPRFVPLPGGEFPLASRAICRAMKVFLDVLNGKQPSTAVDTARPCASAGDGGSAQAEDDGAAIPGGNRSFAAVGVGVAGPGRPAGTVGDDCRSDELESQAPAWEVGELRLGLQAVEFLAAGGTRDLLLSLIYDRPIGGSRWRAAAKYLQGRIGALCGLSGAPGPQGDEESKGVWRASPKGGGEQRLPGDGSGGGGPTMATAWPHFHVLGRSKGVAVAVERSTIDDRVLLADGRHLWYRQTQGSFSNPNGVVNTQVLNWLCGIAGRITPELRPHSKPDLLELFCGGGNHTVALAAKFRRVVAVELDKRLCEVCRFNAKRNGAANVEVIECHSHRFCERLLRQANKGGSGVRLAKGSPPPAALLPSVQSEQEEGKVPVQQEGTWSHRVNLAGGQQAEETSILPASGGVGSFGAILVDPPRAGLDSTTLSLCRHFEHIMYISCNPDALQANLEDADHGLGQTHVVTHAAVFDQFPYTRHTEVGVLLTRKTQM